MKTIARGPGGAFGGGIDRRRRRWPGIAALCVASAVAVAWAPRSAAAACGWGFPVGDAPGSPAPLADNHPVGGMNLPAYGAHLGADFWSGGGCTDLGQPVFAVADGEIAEIVDGLGSYLDVVVIRHEDPGAGTVYSMYGHIARDPGLAEGQPVSLRQQIGTIADVLAYFSPCHTHVEILSAEGFEQGPFCNGCAAAGYHVSPGYDQQAGVSMGLGEAGDPFIEVDDGVASNRWYFVDEFIEARLDASCGRCGDGECDLAEDFMACPQDCSPCAWIEPGGAVLDDAGACFHWGGDPQYWSAESGVGYEGSLQWTHTTDSARVDNWGEWSFAFMEAGLYRLDVWIADGFGESQQAAYVVTHAGGTETIVADQQGADGWLTLGEWSFAAGGGQSLRLQDNTGEPFSSMTRIAFDAVQLQRLDAPAGDDTSGAPPGGSDTTADGASATGASADAGGSDGGPGSTGGGALPSPAGGDRSEGCACRSQPRPAPGGALFMVLFGLARRRRRRVAGARTRAVYADVAVGGSR